MRSRRFLPQKNKFRYDANQKYYKPPPPPPPPRGMTIRTYILKISAQNIEKSRTEIPYYMKVMCHESCAIFTKSHDLCVHDKSVPRQLCTYLLYLFQYTVINYKCHVTFKF